MKQSLTAELLKPILHDLKKANLAFLENYRGQPTSRQPVHTVYGGAQIFKADIAQKMSEGALKTLMTYAPDGAVLAEALGESGKPALWKTIHERVLQKLKREALEDFRIDFEDGYGNRPNAEEDAHAASTARELAEGFKRGILPAFIGIRIKPFNEENIQRSVRTLDLFVSTLLSETGGKLPAGFVITLPKITCTEQSRALTRILSEIERKTGLAQGVIQFEIMVETPQSVIDAEGRSPLRDFVNAGQGRCIGAHLGTYDYTAGCGITAAYQTMANPVCDFAKHVMQVSLAGMPIFLSDGATNIMPVGPHREEDGKPLTREQLVENQQVVHRAWRTSYRHIRHSLETGYYQGWDLHPAQLPVRYAAVYAFFLETLEPASRRLKAFVEKAAKATLMGDVFDDAATGQGLLNFFLQGVACGAISDAEVRETGLSQEELEGRSFLKILQGRKVI